MELTILATHDTGETPSADDALRQRFDRLSINTRELQAAYCCARRQIWRHELTIRALERRVAEKEMVIARLHRQLTNRGVAS